MEITGLGLKASSSLSYYPHSHPAVVPGWIEENDRHGRTASSGHRGSSEPICHNDPANAVKLQPSSRLQKPRQLGNESPTPTPGVAPSPSRRNFDCDAEPKMAWYRYRRPNLKSLYNSMSSGLCQNLLQLIIQSRYCPLILLLLFILLLLLLPSFHRLHLPVNIRKP